MAKENSYYSSNAVYTYLREHNIKRFSFAGENRWVLLYGNISENIEPKLIVAVSAVLESDFKSDSSLQSEHEIIMTAKKISAKSGVPYCFIRFRRDISEVDEIRFFDPSEKKLIYKPISELKEFFLNKGISVKDGRTLKAVNDRTSSAYHNWQRSSLGKNIAVIDLDMWEYDDASGEICSFYELKRSYKTLEEWAPYQKDRANYILFSKFAKLVGVKLYVLYNRRIKNPFFDDVSLVKLYLYDYDTDPPDKYIGIFDIEKFISGEWKFNGQIKNEKQ